MRFLIRLKKLKETTKKIMEEAGHNECMTFGLLDMDLNKYKKAQERKKAIKSWYKSNVDKLRF